MADENKKIVLQIELSADQAASKLVELKEKTQDVKKEQANLNAELSKLDAAGKQGTVAYENIQKELIRVGSELKSLNNEGKIYQRIVDGNTTSQKANEGSLVQLRAQLSALNAEYSLLGEEEKSVSERGIELGSHIRNITDELKKQESALGDNRRNVGNYSSALNDLKGGFAEIATTLGIGLGLSEVTQLANESVKAFEDAELNARKLQTAVSVNGGLQEDYENLINQSAQLQKDTIFSDDSIQQAQTAAAQYGLTANEIENLIPVITDFASATDQDLSAALDTVLKGTEGSDKALKLYGVTVDATGTRVDNLASITDQLNKKFSGQAQIVGETAAGAMKKYQNEVDDLKESLGEKLLPVMQTFQVGLLAIARDITDVLSGDLFSGDSNVSEAFQKRYDLTKKYASSLEEAKLKSEQLRLSNSVTALQAQRDANELGSDEWLKNAEALNLALAAFKAYNDEAARRANTTAKQETDLTKLTLDELKKRKAEAEKSIGPGSQDNVDAITAELEKRQKQSDALKKISEKDAENVRAALEGLKKLQQKYETESLEQAAKSVQEKRAVQRKTDETEVQEAFDKTDKLTQAQEVRDKALAGIDLKYKELARQDTQKDFADAIQQAEEAAKEIDRIAKDNSERRKQDREALGALIDDTTENQFQVQLDAIDREESAMLSSTTYTEDERTKIKDAYSKKRIEIEELEQQAALSSTRNTLSGAASLFAKHTVAYKLLASASAAIDTYQSANAAYKATVGIPYVGPILAPIAAGVAIAAGLVNVAKINSVSLPGQQSFAVGGYTGRGNPKQVSNALGQKPYTYHADEYVVPSPVLNSPEGGMLVNHLERMRLYMHNLGPGPRMVMGRLHAESGGLIPILGNPLEGRAIVNVTGISADEVRSIVTDTVRSMPSPVVSVQEINTVQQGVQVREGLSNW